MVFCTVALIKVWNTILKERIWTNRVDSEIVFPFLQPDIGAPLHAERVIAVREEPNFTLSSTSAVSQVERGHFAHFLFLWCRRVFLEVVNVARNSRTQCSLFLSWVSIQLP